MTAETIKEIENIQDLEKIIKELKKELKNVLDHFKKLFEEGIVDKIRISNCEEGKYYIGIHCKNIFDVIKLDLKKFSDVLGCGKVDKLFKEIFIFGLRDFLVEKVEKSFLGLPGIKVKRDVKNFDTYGRLIVYFEDVFTKKKINLIDIYTIDMYDGDVYAVPRVYLLSLGFEEAKKYIMIRKQYYEDLEHSFKIIEERVKKITHGDN